MIPLCISNHLLAAPWIKGHWEGKILIEEYVKTVSYIELGRVLTDNGEMKLKIPPPILGILFYGFLYFSKDYLPKMSFSYGVEVSTFVIILGVIIDLLAMKEFRKHKTTLTPLHPEKTTFIVTTGIFNYSRNPMYLGLVLILLGISVRVNLVGGIVILPLFVFYLSYFQIIPEEKVLEIKFGDEYLNYKRRVRRWL